MKKILSILLIATILFTSCKKDTISVSIDCTFGDSGMNERKAFIYTLNIDAITAGKQSTLLDSVKIIDGKFIFKAKIPEDLVLGLIYFGGEKQSNNILSDGIVTAIKLTSNNLEDKLVELLK